MARRSLPLGPITVTFPCSASWDAMPGDDRVRFCMECSLQVYNLSALEPEAARALIQEREGKLCVRFYRRDDGTILTQDCPVGLRAFTRRTRIWAASVLAFGLAAVTLGCGLRTRSERPSILVDRLRSVKHIGPIVNRFFPLQGAQQTVQIKRQAAPMLNQVTMGRMVP